MGEVTFETCMAEIRAENPRAAEQDLQLYTGFFLDYVEAERNIRANGAIVVHPRTGSPIENPYNKVKAAAAASLGRLDLRTTRLWSAHGPR
jgi:phage terminase small subunit